MFGNKDSGNSMPERGKRAQAVECLADIRKFGGVSSGMVVFDSGQLSGGNEQGLWVFHVTNTNSQRKPFGLPPGRLS
jgi:hypothetical protein